MVVAVAVLFPLSSPICSCRAQALGEVSASATLATFLLLQTDPKYGRCAATGCECGLVIIVILHWLHISILISTAQGLYPGELKHFTVK